VAKSAGFLSIRDPENFAVSLDGQWFRIATAQSAEALRRLHASSTYRQMTESGRLVTFEELQAHHGASIIQRTNDQVIRPISGDAIVFSVQEVSEVTYPWEWPNALLGVAGQLTLELREALLDLGLDLKDASAFNVQFVDGQPIFIDIGSIEVWRPNPSWNAGKQFIEHFINPLAVGHSGSVAASDAWMMSRGRGIPSSVARQLMSRSLKRRLGLAILQASTRPVAKNAPNEVRYREVAEGDRALALRATRSYTLRLRKTLKRLASDVHQTTWSDYGSREHYSEADLQRKIDLSKAFLKKLDLQEHSLVLDVGGNDGMTARAATSGGQLRCVVLDVDPGALDHLASRALADDTRLRITPLVGDVTNLTPASGLLDQEFAEFTSRIRPSAVFCQAVLHHIVITQGVPMQLAVASLAQFEAPLQIEFADEDDAKVTLLMNQIPNWQGQYSLDLLVESLGRFYERVEIIGRTSPTRVIVEASVQRPLENVSANGH
jgi:ribosomal protein L11 methylase PrmA